MLTRDLLLALREGLPVPAEAVRAFGANLGAGDISDAQAGAFAMAICLQAQRTGARGFDARHAR